MKQLQEISSVHVFPSLKPLTWVLLQILIQTVGASPQSKLFPSLREDKDFFLFSQSSHFIIHFQESVSYSLFINTSNKMTSETMVRTIQLYLQALIFWLERIKLSTNFNNILRKNMKSNGHGDVWVSSTSPRPAIQRTQVKRNLPKLCIPPEKVWSQENSV